MGISMINTSYNRKIKNIVDYTFIVLETLNVSKPQDKGIFKKCISNYFKDFYFYKKELMDIASDEVLDFLEDNKISYESRAKMLYQILEHMVYLEKIKDRPAYIKNIIFISDTLFLMLKLDELVDPIYGEAKTYDEAIKILSEKYKDKINKELINLFPKENRFLKEKVELNIDNFIKAKQALSESPFEISYQVINSTTSKVLTYSRFDYVTKKDHMYNRMEMNEILYKNDISVEFANAIIELVGVEVLKNLFSRQNNFIYFIKMPPKYFDKKMNFIRLKELLEIDFIKERICLIIGAKEYNKNFIKIDDLLTSTGINIAISDIKSISDNDSKIKRNAKYLFSTNEIKTNLEDVKKFALDKKLELIIEDEHGMFDYIPFEEAEIIDELLEEDYEE